MSVSDWFCLASVRGYTRNYITLESNLPGKRSGKASIADQANNLDGELQQWEKDI